MLCSRPNQPFIYQQPGVVLQVGNAAQPAKDGASTRSKEAPAPGGAAVYQQNVNGTNYMDVVSKAMRTNAGNY